MYIYVCVCVYVCMNVYYGRKKTNKLQVHAYKPVSWLPTHRGILKMSGQPRNRLYRYELVLYLSFSSHNIYIAQLLCIEHCFIYIYI